MADTRGRQVVLALTNKSGGSVAAGDVVVFDTTADESFTTTTTARAELSVGIAQETIANNAVGRVLVSGYAALVNVPSSRTRGEYLETHTVVKQATGSATRRSGSFGQFAKTSATPSAWLWGQTDQAASGVSTGTANPGSPADGALFYRTDLDLFIRYRSTGTRWVCSCPHTHNIAHQDQLTPVGATHSARSAYPAALTTQMLIESVAWAIYVNTTNNATNYWTMTFPNGTTLSTSASAANAAIKLSNTTELAVNLSDAWADCTITKVGSPGTIYYAAAFTYRYIVT